MTKECLSPSVGYVARPSWWDERPWSDAEDSATLVSMWIDQRGSEVLSEPECLRLLALAAKGGYVGRLAVSGSAGQAPIVQPVNFAFHEHRVLVRLGGDHMAQAASEALVAFEVDSIERENGVAWSVLVRGLATHLTEADPALDEPGPHPLVPIAGEKLFAVRLDVVTGRRFALRRDEEPS